MPKKRYLHIGAPAGVLATVGRVRAHDGGSADGLRQNDSGQLVFEQAGEKQSQSSAHQCLFRQFGYFLAKRLRCV